MSGRVLIAGFKHETNTFSNNVADLAAYRARALYEDNEVAEKLSDTRTEVAAFLEACDRHGWQPTHPIYADATPCGPVSRDAYEYVVGRIVATAKDKGPFDAVLLSLHGAMVAEHVDDGEGELLARLRAVTGPDTPIAITLDMHANVTDRMAALASIMVSYRTYPHVDHHEIATHAAELVAQTLRGEIAPSCEVARGDLLSGIDNGRTNQPGPMTELLAMARAYEESPDILSISINAGFAWSDIAQAGPSAVVVGNGRVAAQAQIAKALVAEIWARRHRVTVEPLSIAAGLKHALAHRGDKPLIIADTADNPGGGGYGDSTGVLGALIDAGIDNAAFATVFDPAFAAHATEAGVGARISFPLGGKLDARLSPPIAVTEGEVRHLSNGGFALRGPMAAGTQVDPGLCAVVRVGGVDVVVASHRYQVYDLMFFLHAGLDPTHYRVVAVKSSQHFRAAFGPIADAMVVIDAGDGMTTEDLTQLDFKRLRRPVFPLDLA